MRCYFMRGNRIEGVEYLTNAPDADLVKEAETKFRERADQNYDGFEVWDGKRFVYRFPAQWREPYDKRH
jgi:hypothetical protein